MIDEQFTERMEGFIEKQLQLVAKRYEPVWVAKSFPGDDS